MLLQLQQLRRKLRGVPSKTREAEIGFEAWEENWDENQTLRVG